ncbi:conserved hypothetical protein [Beutenbergia cavernae DSM 12333]|uniref:Adhesin domain-containing protein n=1 Tax=Beutenbergia cavernae (strain ATCC BAA-8 / DSM 12333 / CCUG 43141 / JCM 11478 / NBRC 16432 / NCIMB 13614 / HKI 0122) TaxID=471853 RepID=C5C1R0_BEUC1|nr:hypothetical protein [Beutenbergia cavernae]ACQ79528.1 conserved hypothetical protein [Beutenbergia cavernae DSM 12333]
MATSTWILPGPMTLDVADARTLRVQLIGGDVEIVGRDEPGVSIEALEVTGSPLDATLEGDRLTVGYASLGWEGWLKRLTSYRGKDVARLRIAVGRGTGVKVGTVSAAARVEDVHEDVSLATASGALTAEGLHGALDGKSVSGAFTVRAHDGTVRVSSVSGASEVAGRLPRFDASTVSGAVTVTTELPTCVVRATTVSAPVRIHLPLGAGIVLTARTVTAKVLVDGVDRRTSSTPSVTSVTDRTGTDACFVELTTVNGDLDVRRGVPELEAAADE